jgi:proteasome assembly chaperone (PAC2) family protein
VTYLTTQASGRGFQMVSLVAEIPAYVQGRNPKCIEAVSRRLGGILGLHLNLDDMRALSDAFEKKLTEIVEQKEELTNLIHKLEEDYDNEVFDTQMGDLKEWLQQQGIRLD